MVTPLLPETCLEAQGALSTSDNCVSAGSSANVERQSQGNHRDQSPELVSICI